MEIIAMGQRPRSKSVAAKSKTALPPSLVGYTAYEVSLDELAAIVGKKAGAPKVQVFAQEPLPPRKGKVPYRLVVTRASGKASETVASGAFDAGPRARALLRGREIAGADLKSAGGAYTLAEVQVLLHHVTRQRVDQLVRSGDLLAVPGPSNRRRYPAVQFTTDGSLIAGLAEVQAALPTKNPWAVLNFLIHADDRLGGKTPIALLAAGKLASVVKAAARMAEPGA